GPRTIPELAAGRSVTRQQIQKNVEDLRKLKLVTVIENPAHKRSFYVSLSDRGKKLIAGMIAQESSVFRALATEYGLEDLKTTHRVLGTFMRQLESLL
ncbi:MAG: MarR family transcriptional regulator, partial [Leptospiraceae bacterium]|nr:MarR family transcriptional regulator [Leptospiraceae bacterium]